MDHASHVFGWFFIRKCFEQECRLIDLANQTKSKLIFDAIEFAGHPVRLREDCQ